MASPKETYQLNKGRVKGALAILKHDDFDMLMIFAKAQFASRNPTNEQMVGANEFERTLRNMVDPIPEPVHFPTPGLEHNLDVVRKELEDETPSSPAPAPAPAPAAPSPAPAPSTPAPAPEKPSSPFSSLDQRATTIKPKTPPAGSEPKPGEPKPSTEPKPGEAPAGDKKVVESPKWYREQIHAKSTELDKANSRVADYERKIADYERRGLDTEALMSQLKSKEEHAAKLEREMAAIKYEKSPDYKAKHEKPFNDAADYAKQIVEQLQVVTDDGEGQRPATWDDFAELYNMPAAKAEVLANRKFGSMAHIVMRHFDKLKELEHNRVNAVKEYESMASENQKQERAKEMQRRESVNKAWESTNRDLIEANPDAFGENPDDDEGNSIWKESLSLVDKAYTGRDQLTDQEKIILDSHIRLRAAAFPRDQRTIALLKAERDELLGRLGERKASKPGSTQKSGESVSAPAKDWRQELRELNPINP